MWLSEPGLLVGQHYKVAMSVHFHKLGPILKVLYNLLGGKPDKQATANNGIVSPTGRSGRIGKV